MFENIRFALRYFPPNERSGNCAEFEFVLVNPLTIFSARLRLHWGLMQADGLLAFEQTGEFGERKEWSTAVHFSYSSVQELRLRRLVHVQSKEEDQGEVRRSVRSTPLTRRRPRGVPRPEDCSLRAPNAARAAPNGGSRPRQSARSTHCTNERRGAAGNPAASGFFARSPHSPLFFECPKNDRGKHFVGRCQGAPHVLHFHAGIHRAPCGEDQKRSGGRSR